MKFGKQILAQQISGWGAYYLDYKFLKKIINSLEKGRLADAALFATGVRPAQTESSDTTATTTSSSSSGDATATATNTTTTTTDTLTLSSQNSTDSQAQELAHVHGGAPLNLSSLNSRRTSANGAKGGNKNERNAEELQAHKAAFFFKLERELEKINAFYLQKESDLKLRLRVLISKRQSLFSRRLRSSNRNPASHLATSSSSNGTSSKPILLSKDSPSFIALYEGFKIFEKDLSKLQNFIEINATGFRKILKKWDKRSKSQTKELYLARQVEVQPCFNREFIAELSDVVALNVQELENLVEGVEGGENRIHGQNGVRKGNLDFDLRINSGNLTLDGNHQLDGNLSSANNLNDLTLGTPILNLASDGSGPATTSREEEFDALLDLEQSLRDSIKHSKIEKARELIKVAKESLEEENEIEIDVNGIEIQDSSNPSSHSNRHNPSTGTTTTTTTTTTTSSHSQTHISRLIWRALLESSPEAIEIALNSNLIDFNFIDDINSRTCLHESSRAGNLQLVKLCVEHGVEIKRRDAYGREALSYAAMEGHSQVCEYLLSFSSSSASHTSASSPNTINEINEKTDRKDRIIQDQLDMDGFSPLILAVINGRTEVVKILLDHGVQVEAPNQSIKLGGGGGGSNKSSAFPTQSQSPSTSSSDLNPLCLASERGHSEIVSLLLERGSSILSNPEGLTPQALASRSGHAQVLTMLLKKGRADPNVVEKGSKWTPIFFAAENGHEDCLKILLENGASSLKRDEKDRKAEFYAAWNGKINCLKILKAAGASELSRLAQNSNLNDSLMNDLDGKKNKDKKSNNDKDEEMMDLDLDSEMDGIPDLSLPPPIIPFRTYGHNYLDKKSLVSVSLTNSSVKLYKLSDPNNKEGENKSEPFSNSSIKLVMTTRPDDTPDRSPNSTNNDSSSNNEHSNKRAKKNLDLSSTLPHSLNILFPLSEDSEVFSFQVNSLSRFSIQWELMPVFGSKVIGKAVALPSSFEGITDRKRFVLPLQDSFLKLVGEISFEIDFVKPFDSVQLEIGGKVETYWKSLLPSNRSGLEGTENNRQDPSTRMTPSSGANDSLISKTVETLSSSKALESSGNNSGEQVASLPSLPPIATTTSSTTPAPSLVTASSLSGSYLRIVVQVTKDGIPVVFEDLALPVPTAPGLNLDLDVYVGSVTQNQFEGFAEATGKSVGTQDLKNIQGDEDQVLQKWRDELKGKMISLEKLLEILPVTIGIDLHLLYPSSADVRGNPSLPKLEVNHFVDTILHTVYAAGTLSPQQSRKIFFSSRSPTVCTALNWKQPNYAVFFASYCALAHTAGGESILAPCDRNEPDPRRRSVSEAVRFAKSNNLLGIMVDALLLNQVPQLVPSVKAAGLLLIAIGEYNPNATTSDSETSPHFKNSIHELDETKADEAIDGSVQSSIVRC